MAEEVKADPAYDLTHKMVPFFDPHLVFPMFGFLRESAMYDETDLTKAQLSVARKTNYVKFTRDTFEGLFPGESVPEDIKTEEDVLETYRETTDACKPILDLIAPADVSPESEAGEVEPGPSETGAKLLADESFTMEHLSEEFGITEETVDALYRCAKFRYECGEYSTSATYLYYYRLLKPEPSPENLTALWGKFASEILTAEWDEANRDREALHNAIESASFLSKVEALQQRAWLLHWSLYVFFNHEKGRDALVEYFLESNVMNTIQTTAPWLLRYLCTVAVTNKRRWAVTKQLVRVLQDEAHGYSDPIVSFVKKSLVEYNFEGAQAELAACERVLATDFFLKSSVLGSEFVEHARLFVFEAYCHIHHKVDISMLASNLSTDPDTAERWVVELIRNAQLRARIDTNASQVIMGGSTSSVYQRVIEKTKDLSYRTQQLSSRFASRGRRSDGRRGGKDRKDRKDGAGAGRSGGGDKKGWKGGRR